MIALQGIVKTYPLGFRRRTVLDNVSAVFPPGVNVGILGRNGAGKSTLMGVISGSIRPDRGQVVRTSRISWPLGFSGCFNGSLSGRENMRFVSRIYSRDWRKIADFVEDFSELGEYMDQPVNTYSSGMKAKLAFGLSMAMGFDYYLVDEITAVGDASFKAKCKKVFDQRKQDSTLIVVSHSISSIRDQCDVAGVLDRGKLKFYPTIREAVQRYMEACAVPPAIACA